MSDFPSPRLWHSNDTMKTTIRAHLAAGHPHAKALYQRVLILANQSCAQQFNGEVNPAGLTNPLDEHYPVDCAVAYLFSGTALYAERARQAALNILSPWPRADLSIANRSLFAAIVYECCAAAWDEQQRQGFPHRLSPPCWPSIRCAR